MNQHDQRRLGMQILFLLNQDSNLTPEAAMTQSVSALDLSGAIPEYTQKLVLGSYQNRDEINQEITKFLKKGWTLSRLSKINLTILQMAIYEIKNSQEIPATGAVNEALNLAGEFSDDKSKSFINGILSNFLPAQEADTK